MFSAAEEKHLNKNKRFEINEKILYTSPDEEFHENSDSTVSN